MGRRTRGAFVVVPLMLMLTLGLAGCGSADGDDDGVASANSGKDAAGASASPSLSRDEMGVKFAQCMRENGVNMADPEPGKGPMIMMTGGPGGEASMNKAMEACREFDPMANGAANPAMEENWRKYAACMRENGVEAFPDPEPGQKGIKIDGSMQDDPDFATAQQKCQDILSGGGK